jgi:hypothetical protein
VALSASQKDNLAGFVGALLTCISDARCYSYAGGPSNLCMGSRLWELPMKLISARYRAASLFCVGILLAGTAAPAQDSTVKGGQSPPQQTQSPGFEPGPGPTGSRPDTTGTPGSMSAQSGKSAKQHMRECVARTRASNTSLSESDARKTCREAIKAEKDSPHPEKSQ